MTGPGRGQQGSPLSHLAPHVCGEPGAKSLADDLILGQGFVRSRAAPSLRSIESQPLIQAFVGRPPGFLPFHGMRGPSARGLGLWRARLGSVQAGRARIFNLLYKTKGAVGLSLWREALDLVSVLKVGLSLWRGLVHWGPGPGGRTVPRPAVVCPARIRPGRTHHSIFNLLYRTKGAAGLSLWREKLDLVSGAKVGLSAFQEIGQRARWDLVRFWLQD